jgi:hypothetical protein
MTINILKIFNENKTTEDEITVNTTIRQVISSLLENHELIALCVSYSLFTITSLLFLANDSEGYTNPTVELNINNLIPA